VTVLVVDRFERPEPDWPARDAHLGHHSRPARKHPLTL